MQECACVHPPPKMVPCHLSPIVKLGCKSAGGQSGQSLQAMCTVHCTLYTVPCTLYDVYCTLYTVHFTLYAVLCALYTVHSTLYTVYCIPYTVHSTQCIVQCTVYTVHWTLDTGHCTVISSRIFLILRCSYDILKCQPSCWILVSVQNIAATCASL